MWQNINIYQLPVRDAMRLVDKNQSSKRQLNVVRCTVGPTYFKRKFTCMTCSRRRKRHSSDMIMPVAPEHLHTLDTNTTFYFSVFLHIITCTYLLGSDHRITFFVEKTLYEKCHTKN